MADSEVVQEQARPKEQIVDPWRAVAAEGQTSIDYDKLIGETVDGTTHITLFAYANRLLFV